MRLVVVSDLHVNSTLGLWPPQFLGAEATPRPQNKYQAWLWHNWLDTCAWAQAAGDYTLIVNGDSLQGIHSSRDVQLVTVNATDMIRAAVLAVEPLRASARAVYVVKGTDWHEGTCGQDVENFASQIGATVDADSGQFSYFMLSLLLDGKTFAFSHHTPVTTVYYATPLQREWREMKEDAIDFGTLVPDCIVHSHVHRFYPYLDKSGERFTFTTAGWQLKNAYAFRNKPFRPPEIGSLMLWVDHGKIMWDRRLYPLPVPPPVRIGISTTSSLNSVERKDRTRLAGRRTNLRTS